MNFLDMVARNPRGWGAQGPGYPQEGVPDPSQPDRAADAMTMLGPFAEYAAPNLLEMAADPRGTAESELRAGAEQSPYLLLGPGGRALRTAGATGILGATAFPSVAGEAEDTEAIKKLQRDLRDKGYYTGKIDGLMKGGTKAAKAQFEKDQLEKEQLLLKRKETEAAIAETARIAKEEARKAKQREEGAKRLKELDKDKSGFWESYGTPITYGAGATAGVLSRIGATVLPNRAARKAAEELNALVRGGGDLPARVGGVNAFYRRGGASELPFNPAPKGRYGFTSNKKAPSAATLYSERPKSKYIRGGDYAAIGGFGAEVIVSEWQKLGARKELHQAREAVSADPSEANIRRLKAAEDEYAFWEGMANAGRGAMLGYGGAGKFATYKNPRPNAAAAEAERIRIDNTIHQARPIRSRRKK